MKYPIEDRVEDRRIEGPSGEPTGRFILKFLSARLLIQASDGWGWDHVSVSLATRTPSWQELEFVRRAFFKDSEVVMQLHVPKSDHVNIAENCLHLWRPQTDAEIAAIRQVWEAGGDHWPYGELESAGEIPVPKKVMV